MRTKIIALMVIMAAQAQAQTLLSYTNVRADVSGGPAFSATAIAGPLRITYVVEDTPGVPLNLDDGTTFRLEAWAADGVRVQNVASTNLVNTDLSAGQVRFTVPSLGAGEYRIRGVAQPAGGDTTLVWQITHHMLTITSAPSASASISVTSTNVIDLGNLTVQWEIQGDGDFAPDSTDRTIVPHTDLGSSLGKTNERFDEAHINEGYFGTIRAGTVDVETAVGFLDNTKVKLSGETNAVDLTGTSVQVRSPTNDNEVATKGYVDAVAGGELNVGPVQLYTNHVGDVGRTNAAGYFENINDHTPLVGTNIIFNRTYDGGRTWSNLNVTGSAWQNGETNGRGWARGPSESASGRFFDYNAVPTGVPVRCSVDIITPLQSTLLANGTWTWGLSWRDIGGTNNTLISIRAASGSEQIETYIYNLSYSAGQDTRPIAPYNAGNVTLNTYNFGFKDLIFAMDHNGAGTVRYYINGALVYRATNVTPVAGFSIHASMSSAPANSTNTSYMVWDNFRGEYGLWTEAW